MKNIYLNFLVACGVMLFMACSDSGQEITASELGDEWPFTVESGMIHCIGEDFAVVFESGGIPYPINDAARAMENKNYGDINDILKDDPNYQGSRVKMKTSAIEFLGLKICMRNED
mgnify:CR=1 FL=1